MTTNPYAAPKAAVADETVLINADYVPGGQSRPAGNGWSWISASWHLFKRQPGMWIGMWLLFVIIMIGADRRALPLPSSSVWIFRCWMNGMRFW